MEGGNFFVRRPIVAMVIAIVIVHCGDCFPAWITDGAISEYYTTGSGGAAGPTQGPMQSMLSNPWLPPWNRR